MGKVSLKKWRVFPLDWDNALCGPVATIHKERLLNAYLSRDHRMGYSIEFVADGYGMLVSSKSGAVKRLYMQL